MTPVQEWRFQSEQHADVKICGELLIKRGLKRRARKRKLVIDREMKEVLERLLKDSQCDYVFASPQDPTKPLGPCVLEEQVGQIRKDQDPSPCWPARSAPYCSNLGRRVHGPLYVAVCRGTR
jgi:hypothetical protein